MAGDALRSSSRYKALDETGLFGCACRHEFPVLFLDLKHGERYMYVDIKGNKITVFFPTNFSLAYGEFILDSLIERTADNVEIYVMYDIACTLYKHLKVRNLMEHLISDELYNYKTCVVQSSQLEEVTCCSV